MNHSSDPVLFSVIIPAYNTADYLEATLDTVRGQSFKSYEICVTNDGSTDETAQILATYERKHPDVSIIVIDQENRGIGAARNAAIRRASGIWLAFLDADDAWQPGKLEQVWAQLERHPEIDVIYHDECEVWPTGERKVLKRRPLKKPYYQDLLIGSNPLSPTATVVRREWVQKLGGFSEEEELNSAEDIDLWLRLARSGAEFAYLRQELCEYNRVPDSVTMKPDYHADRSWRVFERHYGVVRKLGTIPDHRLKKLYQHRLAQNQISRATGHALLSNFRVALSCARKAVSVAPLWWKVYAAFGWVCWVWMKGGLIESRRPCQQRLK